MSIDAKTPSQTSLQLGDGERVLIVDDEPVVRGLLLRWLTSMGFICEQAVDGLEALQRLQADHFDLLISDIKMPRLDGITLLHRARNIDATLAVIMITAMDDRATAIHTLRHGAYGYIIKPFDQNEVAINIANALERQRLTRLSLNYERELEEQVRLRTADIYQREEEITLRLVAASEFRDDETGGHIRRIGLYAEAMGRAIGWPPERTNLLRLAAPMHDIGKIGIPDHILLKPGKFTPEEFDVMKHHTEIGADILGDSRIAMLQMAREITLFHHERWNGAGYPRGLQQADIPDTARIVALVDVYDALLTDRVYRPAFSEIETLSMMKKEQGLHFDPQLFTCLTDIHTELREIRQTYVPAAPVGYRAQEAAVV